MGKDEFQIDMRRIIATATRNGKPVSAKEFVDFTDFLEWATNLFVAAVHDKYHRTVVQRDFATWLGFGDQAFSQYKNGRRKPDLKAVETMETKLGHIVPDLLGYKRSMPEDPELYDLVDSWPRASAAKKAKIMKILHEARESEDHEGETKNHGVSDLLSNQA